MPYVQVKQKYQVTIPAAIRKKISLHEGDTLEAMEQDGVIILAPQTVQRRSIPGHKKPSLLSLAGANQGSGLYTSAQAADQYIDQLRAEWK